MTGHAARRIGNMVEAGGRTFEVKIASGSEGIRASLPAPGPKVSGQGLRESRRQAVPVHTIPRPCPKPSRSSPWKAAGSSATLPPWSPTRRSSACPWSRSIPMRWPGSVERGDGWQRVTSLADDGLGPREFIQVFVSMIRLMKQYHLRIGGDTWLAAVNPRHSAFYRKVIGACFFGDRRSYPSVANAPAEASARPISPA